MTRLWFLLVLFISGCATTSVDSGFTLSPDSPNGLVVSSVTYAGMFSGYRVSYRSLDGKVAGVFQAGEGNALFPNQGTTDFGNGNRGNLIAKELPPGDYEIYTWSVLSGFASVYPKNAFSIRFTVVPGKAVYVGNFHFTQTSSFGLTVTGALLSFIGDPKRDLGMMRERYKNLSSIPIAASVSPETKISELGGVPNLNITVPLLIRVPR